MYARSFLTAYRAAFGTDPPEEFTDVYETLLEALYWGAGHREMSSVNRRGRGSNDYFFADVRLLPVKGRVDKTLAACAAQLLRATYFSEEESGSPTDVLGRKTLERDGRAGRSAEIRE